MTRRAFGGWRGPSRATTGALRRERGTREPWKTKPSGGTRPRPAAVIAAVKIPRRAFERAARPRRDVSSDRRLRVLWSGVRGAVAQLMRVPAIAAAAVLAAGSGALAATPAPKPPSAPPRPRRPRRINVEQLTPKRCCPRRTSTPSSWSRSTSSARSRACAPASRATTDLQRADVRQRAASVHPHARRQGDRRHLPADLRLQPKTPRVRRDVALLHAAASTPTPRAPPPR